MMRRSVRVLLISVFALVLILAGVQVALAAETPPAFVFQRSVGQPRGLGFDASGNYFVQSQTDSMLEHFTAGGTEIERFGANGVDWLAVDHHNTLYLSFGSNKINGFVAGNTHLGSTESFSFGNTGLPNTTAGPRIGASSGIAVDSAGYIYVADISKNRVQKYDGTSAGATPSPDRAASPSTLAMATRSTRAVASQRSP